MYNINISSISEAKKIKEFLLQDNLEKTGNLFEKNAQLSFNIKNEKGEIVAGITGEYLCNWVEVYFLWVKQSERGKHLGTLLLEKIEEDALERNCLYVKLDTFEFQALEFYKKHGYEVFGTLENTEQKLTHYYLVKYLKK